jgi:hypothetical protein
MDLTKLISYGGSAAAAVTALYGGGTWVDDRYAHQDDVVLIDMRLEQSIQLDALKETRARLYQLEDRYKDSPMPPSVQEEYRQLKNDLEQAQYQLNGVRQQMNEMQYQRSKSQRSGK